MHEGAVAQGKKSKCSSPFTVKCLQKHKNARHRPPNSPKADNSNRPFWITIVFTVSYTHLDVYKRQPQSSSSSIPASYRARFTSMTRCFTFTQQSNVKPVSYTHLDVYKRQTFRFSRIIALLPNIASGFCAVLLVQNWVCVFSVDVLDVLWNRYQMCIRDRANTLPRPM